MIKNPKKSENSLKILEKLKKKSQKISKILKSLKNQEMDRFNLSILFWWFCPSDLSKMTIPPFLGKSFRKFQKKISPKITKNGKLSSLTRKTHILWFWLSIFPKMTILPLKGKSFKKKSRKKKFLKISKIGKLAISTGQPDFRQFGFLIPSKWPFFLLGRLSPKLTILPLMGKLSPNRPELFSKP